MTSRDSDGPPPFGSPALRLPDALRGPLKAHLAELKEQFLQLGWGTRGGFGSRPALIVIDLALWWTRPGQPPMGSNVDSGCRRCLSNASRRSCRRYSDNIYDV